MTNGWNPAINQILYGLIYTDEITDETVNWIADSAVHYTTLPLGPEAYRRAIDEALDSSQPLDSLGQLPQFDQAQLTSFLRAVADRLDAMRPWPEPKFHEVHPPEAWQFLRRAVLIARLEASIPDVIDVVRTTFQPADDENPGKEALILTLNTGETIALLGSYARGEKLSLLAGVHDTPSTVIEHFVSATGFPRAKIVPISPTDR